MEKTIKNVLYTLNTIEVHGKKDIESMLGCMQALEKLLRDASAQSVENSSSPPETPGMK